MRSHTFNLTFTSYDYPDYANVSAVGTSLEGITAGTPLAVTVQTDLSAFDLGNGTIQARVSDLNTIRFRSSGVQLNIPVSVTVTELVEE